MTCVATTSPTRLAAAAPASTALRTAATSPRTIAVTRPASIFSQPTSRTFAALTIASAASIIATRPLHSTMPSASSSIPHSPTLRRFRVQSSDCCAAAPTEHCTHASMITCFHLVPEHIKVMTVHRQCLTVSIALEQFEFAYARVDRANTNRVKAALLQPFISRGIGIEAVLQTPRRQPVCFEIDGFKGVYHTCGWRDLVNNPGNAADSALISIRCLPSPDIS